jgi:phosphatidylethanolamine-binding protein (PEBP) family uncharacterized protein
MNKLSNKSYRKTRINKLRNNKTRKCIKRIKGGMNLDINYNNIKVSGQELPKSITQMKPNVKFPNTGRLYTLIMWDPDVPQHIQPGFVHWIAINLKSKNDIKNNSLLPYKGPAPPSGIHRYYFGLFEQQRPIHLEQLERINFNIDTFIKENNLRKLSDVFMKVAAI